MKKIGITGSLASGKTTASKILSNKKGPLFSADKVVRKLYQNERFLKILSKKFNISKKSKVKIMLKKKILEKRSNIKKLEKIFHPIVRKEMNIFLRKHQKRRFIFLEIPLLVESKLMKKFDIIFFIKAKRSTRLKRYMIKGGDKKFFDILNNKQLSDSKKIKYCDHIIVNDKNLKFLKKKLLDIFKDYE